MKRKAAIQRLKSIDRLRSFIQSHHERLSRDLALRPASAGDTRTYQHAFEYLDAELAAVESELTAAEDAYARDKRQVAIKQRQHREAKSALFSLQTDVKRLLTGLLPCGLDGTAIEGATPQDATALTHQVKLTMALLRDLEDRAPAPFTWVTFDAGVLAAQLKTSLDTLKTSFATLSTARAAAFLTRTGANGANAEAGRVVLWVTRCAEGFAGLAGHEQLTRQIKAG